MRSSKLHSVSHPLPPAVCHIHWSWQVRQRRGLAITSTRVYGCHSAPRWFGCNAAAPRRRRQPQRRAARSRRWRQPASRGRTPGSRHAGPAPDCTAARCPAPPPGASPRCPPAPPAARRRGMLVRTCFQWCPQWLTHAVSFGSVESSTMISLTKEVLCMITEKIRRQP